MIKLIGTGLWVCLVTLGSVYFSVQVAIKDDGSDQKPNLRRGLETVRGDIVSVPVISEGAVQGYFITRLSYTAVASEIATLSVPADQLITDALYSALIGSEEIDLASLRKFNIDTFRETIRSAVNSRLGEEIFHDVIVEQIDFLNKQDIRANMRKGERSVSGVTQPVGRAVPSQ
ncbi:hypothetical protein [Pseudohoeflea coraliihabitans]|uniref:Flagellar basal body-associated protein FliL n=1 Tax=Pseudohoeflea coraliihabitans TaxID=2860393 RepID=A0ABS6WN04_9HYPH|nr:hypothetical protein [Pseudohoeflea sp. DP4N28-3]MBW3097342.1 hypothetical protein [Pseudohoeflea sp. DP4N28-3]